MPVREFPPSARPLWFSWLEVGGDAVRGARCLALGAEVRRVFSLPARCVLSSDGGFRGLYCFFGAGTSFREVCDVRVWSLTGDAMRGHLVVRGVGHSLLSAAIQEKRSHRRERRSDLAGSKCSREMELMHHSRGSTDLSRLEFLYD